MSHSPLHGGGMMVSPGARGLTAQRPVVSLKGFLSAECRRYGALLICYIDRLIFVSHGSGIKILHFLRRSSYDPRAHLARLVSSVSPKNDAQAQLGCVCHQ
jgi:hypothetical protein